MPTNARCSAVTAIAALVLFAATAAAQPPNPYRTITGLVKPPAGRTLGSMSMVDVAKDGSVWIAERCGENNCVGHDTIAPIIHTDANGKWIAAFGAGKFAWPHGIYIDPDGNLWVTDARAGAGRGHQVIKFASDGGELMRLGVAGEAGEDSAHFNGPTDVVVGFNGDVFVSDGHEPQSNNRVLKFDRAGKFIKSWGGTGSGPGQFLVPHALALDSRGRLFVADRDNNRIQIFEQDGTFVEEWKQYGRPSGLHISADDTLYVSDNQSNEERHPGWARGIRVGSATDGSIAAFIPDPDFDPKRSQETGAHGLAADARGAIYGAEVYSQSVKKYVR